jgi:thymidylate kinase
MNEILHLSLPPLEHINTTEPNPILKLELVQALLDEFHSNNISYCHWKSNEHLGASMSGDTDLDVLFDFNQKESLETILHELGFKRFTSIRQKQYRDIEDFLGLDLASGKVIHLHAHFKLTLGESYLKSYQLDFEDRILKSRIFDETHGIYCSSPAFELILLFIREALKIRHRDVVAMRLLNKVHYSGNILVEYNWLKQRVNDSEIELILKSLFTDYRPIHDIISGELDRRKLYKLAAILGQEFRAKRFYSAPKALMLRWYREFTVKLFRVSARLLNSPIVSQRINPRGGLCIAVIGADGSGKSTVTADLQRTFKTKLDVYKVYLGRGDGKKSFARRILLWAKQLIAPAKGNINKNSSSLYKPKMSEGLFATVYRCIEALTVASEKKSNLKLAHQAKQKGMLVICDRFPQNQLMGYNDGPLLHHLLASKNPVLKAISRKEAKVYDYANNNTPDIIFKLIANAEVVEARKPGETALEVLEKKISGIQNLNFGNGCQVVTIDASQPLEKVLQTIKKLSGIAIYSAFTATKRVYMNDKTSTIF